MTIVESSYFDETVGRLRERGHDVRHFALLAERATVLRRLRKRGLGHAVTVVAGRAAPLRQDSFAVSKLDLCLDRLREPAFAEHVRTDRIRGRLRRTWTGATHIRFD